MLAFSGMERSVWISATVAVTVGIEKLDRWVLRTRQTPCDTGASGILGELDADPTGPPTVLASRHRVCQVSHLVARRSWRGTS
jgi:hypothetical protein